MHHLYEVVNAVNGKKYIGVSNNPKKRFYHHLREDSPCTKLRNAMNKYGRDNFKLNVLCIGSKEYIYDLESKCIELYDTYFNGYNTMRNTWTGVDPTEDFRERVSKGLLKYYRGEGTNNKYPKDEPVFVTGFWYPNMRTAVRCLGVYSTTLYNQKQKGVLGDTWKPRSDSYHFIPAYSGGFWFPSIPIAANTLNVHEQTIIRRTKRGDVEQYVEHFNAGENNPMAGLKGAQHHNSRAILVNGVRYDSISCAVRADIGFTKSMIEKRLKKGVEGFSYA